jgi:hypothetical protein
LLNYTLVILKVKSLTSHSITLNSLQMQTLRPHPDLLNGSSVARTSHPCSKGSPGSSDVHLNWRSYALVQWPNTSTCYFIKCWNLAILWSLAQLPVMSNNRPAALLSTQWSCLSLPVCLPTAGREWTKVFCEPHRTGVSRFLWRVHLRPVSTC